MMKMKMEIKNRSHRYDINRPWSRRGHKYNKYKKCLSMMMLLCIKQRLSNIWSSIREKLSNTQAEFKKSIASKKKHVFYFEHIINGAPVVYKWKYQAGESMKGTFYNKELQKVIEPNANHIEKYWFGNTSSRGIYCILFNGTYIPQS